jgi:hypothetical protein
LFKLTDSEVIHYSGYYLKTNILILWTMNDVIIFYVKISEVWL